MTECLAELVVSFDLERADVFKLAAVVIDGAVSCDKSNGSDDFL